MIVHRCVALMILATFTAIITAGALSCGPPDSSTEEPDDERAYFIGFGSANRSLLRAIDESGDVPDPQAAGRAAWRGFAAALQDLNPPGYAESAHAKAANAASHIARAPDHPDDYSFEELISHSDALIEACFELQELANEHQLDVALDCPPDDD